MKERKVFLFTYIVLVDQEAIVKIQQDKYCACGHLEKNLPSLI